MALGQEKMIAERVRDVAQHLGYEATIGAEAQSSGFLGWFRDQKFVPDILLRRGGRTAIVEVKARPVVTYDIFQMKRMRGDSDLAALICVPDPEYHRTAPSVRLYAEEVDVSICPFSKVDVELRELLDRS